MSPYDSDNTAVSNQADTELGDAYEGADRITQKYRFPLKIGALYTSMLVVGYLLHLVAPNQFVNTIGALLVYFTFIFAAVTVFVGVLFKLTEVVRSDW
ncbi:hypothetical protein [Halobacterium zhouii]|uniref:hypothetical protein n=1 Tax=Halobacterium zhouii TaxID=2902624 RepID=UPI001E2F0951|nr:hypothetical protein [Halobacterium zhouii]